MNRRRFIAALAGVAVAPKVIPAEPLTSIKLLTVRRPDGYLAICSLMAEINQRGANNPLFGGGAPEWDSVKLTKLQ